MFRETRGYPTRTGKILLTWQNPPQCRKCDRDDIADDRKDSHDVAPISQKNQKRKKLAAALAKFASADGGIGPPRNSEISKILQTPVSHGRRAFSSNGALSGTTAGVTFANRVEFFDWLILDGPLHSNANRYILFSYGGTLPFRYRKYRPQNGSPLKIYRGALVIRPKKTDR